VTLRSLVQPVDAHGSSLVSGMSRDGSGPDVPNRSSPTAERIVGAQPFEAPRVAEGPGGHVGEIEAEVHRAHHGGHRLGLHLLTAVLEQRAVPLECLLQVGRRVCVPQATRSALGATAAVGSSCRNVSWSTTAPR
jgi:hypothetical protein